MSLAHPHPADHAMSVPVGYRSSGDAARDRLRTQRKAFRWFTGFAALIVFVLTALLSQRFTTTGAASFQFGPASATTNNVTGTPDQSLFSADSNNSSFFRGGASLGSSSGSSIGRSRSS